VPEPGDQPKWFKKILFIVFAGPLFVGLTGNFPAGYAITPALFIVWSVIHSKRKKSWEKAAMVCVNKRTEILEQAKSLT
jgi:hypothetical protein